MKQHKYSVEVTDPELELDERLDLHERGWFAQKVGIIFLFLIVLSAAAGLYGQGLLSKQTHTVGHTEVRHERYFRQDARMDIEISISSAPGNRTVISFPNTYLKGLRIESVLPEPAENRAEGGRIRYVFEGSAPMHVVFHVIPRNAGQLQGTMQVNDTPFQLSHFIYP